MTFPLLERAPEGLVPCSGAQHAPLVQAASLSLRAPIAGVTVAHADRQFLQCHLGLAPGLAQGLELPPGTGFCGAVMEGGAPLRLEDVARLPGGADNPATAAFGIRSYLGTPLQLGTDLPLKGALFVADRRPRAWTDEDAALLEALARMAAREVQLALDVERQRRAKALAAGQQRVLELLATGQPLPEVLDAIARLIESHAAGTLCSLLLLEGGGAWLRHGAAPSLPAGFLAQAQRIPVGPAMGSCGTAAHRKERVLVADIAIDPLWKDVRELALGHGLRACWSQPFFGARGEVLGTCAAYSRTPAAAQAHDLELLEVAARLAGIAVEHARTDGALARSEAHYRRLVQSSPYPIYVLDARGHLVEANDAVASLLGRGLEQLHGRHFGELVAASSLPAMSGIFGQLVREEVPGASFDVEVERLDGERRLLAVTATPMRTADGVVGLHGIGRDITEERRTQAALREKERALEESHDRLALALESSGQSMWEVDVHDAGAVARGWAALAHPEDAPAVVRALERHLAGQTASVEVEYRLPTAEGGWRGVLDRGRVVARDPDGRPLRLLGTRMDVSERKKAEQMHARLAAIMDSSSDAILLGTPDLVVTDWNRAAQALFGYTPAEVIGRHISFLAPPDLAHEPTCFVGQALAGTPVVDRETVRAHRDGRRVPVSLTVSPLRDPEGRVVGFSSIVRDITERRSAHERLEHRLRIETAIAHISSRLASGAPGAVDEALRVVGEVTGVTSASVAQQRDGSYRSYITHEWCAPGAPAQVPGWNREERAPFGWYLDHMFRCEVVVVADVQALPPEAHVERAFLEAQGVRSQVAVPLVDGRGKVAGFMVLTDTRSTRTWPDEDLRLLRTVADMLAAQLERERMLREIQESERRYRELVELSPDAILIHAGGVVTFANSMALRLFGAQRAEEVVGRPILSFTHPAHHAQLQERVERMLETGEPAPFIEYQVVRVDGTTFNALIASAPYRHEGRPAIQVVFHDLTQRKSAEEALRTVFNGVSDAIFVHELDGTLIDVNERFLEMYGVTREEVLRLSIADDLSATDNAFEELPTRWRRALGGERQHFPWNARRPHDGATFCVDVFLTRISYAGRDALLATARDVTEQQRLEAQLRQAQKMEAVGRLAGGVAHDFNNLLTVIHCHAGFLQADLPAQDPLQEDVQQVKAAAERASGLTRQLLAFSRKQMLRPKALDLNGVVADLEKMLQRLIGEDIAFSTRLEVDLARVLADPGQMEQVLMNLVVNARDAMPRGGTLCIATANVTLHGARHGRPAYVKPGAYVQVSVQDSGCGIPPDVLPHIFEPFFTTKEAGRGTGLGLATVYGIVKQSDGYVWAESEPGAGTTFFLLLPQAHAPTEEAGAEVAGSAEAGSGVVLLVEDEAGVRRLARRVLERRGYQVLEAAGGEEALAAARQHAGPIHLLLTDVVMPGMSGSLVAERVRALRPEVRVLFMSGYNEDEVVRKGVLADARALLEKPFSPDVLARRVREALAAHAA